MQKHENKTIKKIIAGIGFTILLFLLFYYKDINEPDLVLDAVVSIALLAAYYWKYNALRQDNWSSAALFFAVVLHNLHLYGSAPFGVAFDHYMHYVAGVAIALFVDRYFYERLTHTQRVLLLCFAALGLGAVGEIMEWLGYGILGSGKGFFYFGVGDEGEWRNAVLDMSFDLLGGLTIAVCTLFRKK